MRLKFLMVALLGIIIALLAYPIFRTSANSASFATPYQAVLLTSGQVYFGHLEGFGTEHPILREVYYVRVQTNAETKQSVNVLVRRGQEWHGPDRMYLNPAHIILVEPVSADSQVAKLIAEQKK